MTLRQDFEDILRDFGHDVLLVRAATEVRCSCWDEKRQESSLGRKCPACFGLGVVPIVEKHTVRREDSSIAISYPDMATNSPFGELAAPGFRYFSKHDVRVQVSDLIVEVDWSQTGKPVFNGGYVSEVNHIDVKRWERGEIAFKKIYTSDQPIEKKIRGVRIANVNGIKNYELIREGVS